MAPSQVEAVPPTRPPRVIDRRGAIEKAEGWARNRLSGNLKKLLELAAGVYIVAPVPKGQKPEYLILRNPETGHEEVLGFGLVVYRTPPSLAALQYLVDRGMGKVPTRLEVTGEDGGAISIIPWRPALEEADVAGYIEAEYSDASEEEASEGEAAGRARGDAADEQEAGDQELPEVRLARSFAR